MEIASIVFGKIEVDEGAVVRAAQGLYGLESLTEYVLLQQDPSLPFVHFQAIEEPGVCLLVTDPFVFDPTYEFDLSPADLQVLGNPQPSDVQVWVTVTTQPVLEDSTMNLLAPIIVNTGTRTALQVVLHESGYQTRTPMFFKKEEE